MKTAKAVTHPYSLSEMTLKDKFLFTFLAGLIIFWTTRESFNQDYNLKVDCLETISKIQEYYGEIPSYVQWTRFSSFTHQGQCSAYL